MRRRRLWRLRKTALRLHTWQGERSGYGENEIGGGVGVQVWLWYGWCQCPSLDISLQARLDFAQTCKVTVI